MRAHWQTRIAVIAATALATTACVASGAVPSTSRHISNRELTMEKTGRVVDADTGAGIPGVKVIVDWETLSSGVPGYSSTGGTWCDLQKIVTTDADGNYTIPDVSKELDLSDRGTRIGKTPFGLASATHDKNYVLAVFRPGYMRVEDMETVKQLEDLAKRQMIGGPSLASVPDVNFSAGRSVIKTITMRKSDLAWSDMWAYYAMVPLGCSDRMANAIQSPEVVDIRKTIQSTVRSMPCKMAPETTIDHVEFNAYWNLSLPPSAQMNFYKRVKELQGIPSSRYGYDPTERITTTAGVLCQALREEDGAK